MICDIWEASETSHSMQRARILCLATSVSRSIPRPSGAGVSSKITGMGHSRPPSRSRWNGPRRWHGVVPPRLSVDGPCLRDWRTHLAPRPSPHRRAWNDQRPSRNGASLSAPNPGRLFSGGCLTTKWSRAGKITICTSSLCGPSTMELSVPRRCCLTKKCIWRPQTQEPRRYAGMGRWRL